MAKQKRFTRKQLHRLAQVAELQKSYAGPVQVSKRWVEHDKEMKIMLKGIDLERAGYG